MADTANIAACGEGNPSHTKTGNTPRDVRDNRDDSALGASGPDAAILSAWAGYLAARAALDALPDAYESEAQEALETEYWAKCSKAEATILEEVATTPAGAAIKVKTALVHMLTYRKHDAALRAGDLAALADPELDWSERVLVSALHSLEGMEA